MFSSFSTPDIQATQTFYGETLGIEVKKTPEGLELHVAGGGAPIFVYPSDDYTAPEHTVLNFLVEDIDKVVDALKEKGISMEQYDLDSIKTDEKGVARNDGTEMGPKAIAWLKDPAEHILALIQEK